MAQILLVIHLLVAIALIGVVMLQRSEGGGLGMGGGNSLMSVRGSANILTRATGFLAATFMVTSIVLAIIASRAAGPSAIVEEAPFGAQTELPAAPAAPVEPAAPAGPAPIPPAN